MPLNGYDLLVALAVAASLALALWLCRAARRKGGGCGGNCAACPGCARPAAEKRGKKR